MHATIRRYEGVDQTRTDELTRKVNESLVPKLSKLPGFNGYFLIDGGNGVFSLRDRSRGPALPGPCRFRPGVAPPLTGWRVRPIMGGLA